MSKQILRKVSLIVLPLLVIGIASYFLITSNAKEVKAFVAGDLEIDLFVPYETWPNSSTRKTGTAAEWLHAMRNNLMQGTAVSHLDINGDGLVDILIHQDADPIEGNPRHYYGILLNRGDLTFDFAYKCVIQYTNGAIRFYGDCAAL